MMEYIHRLPFIFGALMASIIGMINYKYNFTLKQICVRMTVAMVIFYIIGLYLRSTVEKLNEEIEKKKDLEKIAERERLEQEELEKKKQQPVSNVQQTASTIDYHVDDNNDDEFRPLNVNTILTGNNNNK